VCFLLCLLPLSSALGVLSLCVCRTLSFCFVLFVANKIDHLFIKNKIKKKKKKKKRMPFQKLNKIRINSNFFLKSILNI
jgi:uncharacterized membrane protein